MIDTMLRALMPVWAWAVAHPTIAWPILTAVLTVLFKPRTPEAYARLASRHPAWLFARVAAFLQLLGALGLDPVKAAAVLIKLIGGKQEPPPPPPPALPDAAETKRTLSVPPPGLLILLALSFGFGFSSSGCALFTKGGARTVLDIAQSVCIIANQELPDSDVAKVCGLSEPFFGPMRELLASSREASAKAASKASAARCK